MTTVATQPGALFDDGSAPNRTGFDPPSMAAAVGLVASLAAAGRRMTGTITLLRPNPKRGLKCSVEYTAPKDWSNEHHESALRVAAHWFRDIGGFRLLAKRQLCHIVQRLKEGFTEREMHAAVTTYAASTWHREGKRWTTINKFFLGEYLEKWIEESPEHHLRADARDMAATDRAEEQRQQRFSQRQARQSAIPQPASRAKAHKKTDSNSPQTLQAVFSEHNVGWVFGTLGSKRKTRSDRERAIPHAIAFVTEHWEDIPSAIRQAVNVKVQAAMFGIKETDPAKLADTIGALRVAKLRDAYRKEWADTKPIGAQLGRLL